MSGNILNPIPFQMSVGFTSILIHPIFGVLENIIQIRSIELNSPEALEISVFGNVEWMVKWMDIVHNPFNGQIGEPLSYKSSLICCSENINIVLSGVFPTAVDYDISSAYARVNLACDRVTHVDPDQMQNFGLIFHYIKAFAEEIGARVDVSHAPGLSIHKNRRTITFNFDGKIVYGSKSAHIADPRWEDEIKRWFKCGT